MCRVLLDEWRGDLYGLATVIGPLIDADMEIGSGNNRDASELYLIDGRWRVDNLRVLGRLHMA